MTPWSRALFAPLAIGLVMVGAGLLSGCTSDRESDSSRDMNLKVLAPSPDSMSPDSATVASGASDSMVVVDVPYVGTPQEVVERMLQLAEVSERDRVYDLGSGDGRIVITAAQQFGAEGVGIEINPELVEEARGNAELAGVSEQVEFRHQDLFEADFSDATVVTLYLLSVVNRELRPELFEQLSPGDRVVSHDFDMGGWEPDTTVEENGSKIHLWRIPEEVPEALSDSVKQDTLNQAMRQQAPGDGPSE